MEKKIASLKEIANLILFAYKSGEKELTLKTSALVDLMKKIEADEIAIQTLLVQKVNLVGVLKEKGVSEEEIIEILKK